MTESTAESPAKPSRDGRRSGGRDAAWSDSTQNSQFDGADTPTASRGERPAVRVVDGVFDVCHVGMVLRAVLFVEAVLGIGILFGSNDAADAATRLALGSAVALPAVLLWLSLTCLWRHRLTRLGSSAQWLAAAALGAVCAGFANGAMFLASRGLVGVVPGFAPVVAGGFVAGLLTVWLQLRNQALLPADTTARLAELQSRIRPHFLFNTLNSALGLIRRDPQRAEALLEDLSELFRVALSSDATVVSLGEEIELAKRYLAIEQIRHGARLQVVWQLDPRAASARVPPLLLQPLVENAVCHGIEPDPEGGVIRISSRVHRGEARLSITNTMPTVPGGRPGRGHGMALQNVRERLRLMHDVAARFEIHADVNKFRVQLAVPLDAANTDDANSGADTR